MCCFQGLFMGNGLALDLGTKTGFCISNKFKIVKSGTVNFGIYKDKSLGGRFFRFSCWLNSIIILSPGFKTKGSDRFLCDIIE